MTARDDGELRLQILTTIDAVTGGRCPVDIADGLLPLFATERAAALQEAIDLAQGVGDRLDSAGQNTDGAWAVRDRLRLRAAAISEDSP